MTGYGKHTLELPQKKITIEIKSLNSKQLDLSTRIPSVYREKELMLRSELSKGLIRGKVEFGIHSEQIDRESAPKMNSQVIEEYYTQMKQLSDTLHIEMPQECLSTLVRLPEVFKSELPVFDEQEWAQIMVGIGVAVDQLTTFRNQEGKMLENLFIDKISRIRQLLQDIAPYESERVDRIKNKIEEALSSISSGDYDKNRLEQELIFYIEKLDVNEEKSRLSNHLDYFIETMHNEEAAGRKLGFIAQEMGREINTLGSKSNHSMMQRIVVEMKDELEQIKEQILNVL